MSKTSPEERLQKRFFREVLLWAKLRHPNIVPLLSYAMLSNGVPSLVSPRYPNCNLKEYLELNPKAGRHSLVNDVAKALSYLHSISVVHGDIKAENVLIDAEGVASMCDFGLSQFLDKAVRITTTQANTGGTDRYLCPELLEEDKKTTMSDMWALACLIMLILTDEIPHARVTSRAMVFNAILRGTHPYTKPDKPIKESLWNSVVKCWSISPVDRPSASDMESLILLEILVKNNSSSQTEVVIAQPSASSLSSDASPSSSSDPPGISGIKTTDFPPPAVLNDPITSEGLGMDDILPKLSTKVPVDTILRRRTGPTIVPGWAVPPRVLLVDDDPVSRKLFSKFLQVCGCTIGVAVDGIGAVNKVNLEKYDLVLMDIVMPKLDGASATSLIRQFDHMTPIISMTSNSRPNEVLTYFSSGMNDILPKPFTKENLFTMLEKHLGHLKQQMSKPSIDTSDPSSSKQSLNEDGVVIGTNAMRNTLKRGLDKVDDDGTTSKTGIFEVLE
ncbi:kinase-regulated stress-responsive transcription factor skn7 [Tulasnella sp. 419]|nr:kinase-regulated stress-responsive transcription factor skn7 [Tulasnella sp. 419]